MSISDPLTTELHAIVLKLNKKYTEEYLQKWNWFYNYDFPAIKFKDLITRTEHHFGSKEHQYTEVVRQNFWRYFIQYMDYEIGEIWEETTKLIIRKSGSKKHFCLVKSYVENLFHDVHVRAKELDWRLANKGAFEQYTEGENTFYMHAYPVKFALDKNNSQYLLNSESFKKKKFWDSLRKVALIISIGGAIYVVIKWLSKLVSL